MAPRPSTPPPLQLTRIIYAYLALSAFSVFFFLVGDLAVQVVATLGLALDWATLALGLLNFSVLGVAVLFVLPGPLAAKQGYLLATAVGTAYVFTHVPEWTTWALLGGMAVYDLYAVLTPHGPLKARGAWAGRWAGGAGGGARAQVGQHRLILLFQRGIDRGLYQLRQLLHLLELAAGIRVQPAIVGEDVQRLEQGH